MPIYEYKCECNKEKEVRLSYSDIDQPQVCECGIVMRKKMSVSSFVMGPYGAMSPAARKLYDVSKPALHREV